MATTTNNGWATPDDTAFVYQGAQAMRTLGQNIDTAVGTGLLVWTAYTPTVGGTGWAKGSGTTSGRYCKIGKTVHFEIIYNFSTAGGGSAGGSALTLSLPETANSTLAPNYVNVVYVDASPAAQYVGLGSIITTVVTCLTTNAGGTYAALNNVTTTTPMTWATGDEVRINGTYECV